MTDQEINITIAEECGWRIVQGDSLRWRLENTITGDYRAWRANEVMAWSEGPNYCADLNAIHEAEGTLTDAQVQQYIEHLIDVTNARTMLKFGITSVNYWSIYHATARQRSEAFWRTIGKWTE